MAAAQALHYGAVKQLALGYREAASTTIAQWRDEVVALLSGDDAGDDLDRVALSDTTDAAPSLSGARVDVNGGSKASANASALADDKPLTKPTVGDYAALEQWAERALGAFRAALAATLESRVAALQGGLHSFVETEHASVDAVVSMQQRMHDERVQRIEESVVNVRQAELLLHRNRIGRHCRGLEKELELENDRFLSVQDEVHAKAEAFAKEIAGLQARLDPISDLDLLAALRDKAAAAADGFRADVRKRLQQYVCSPCRFCTLLFHLFCLIISVSRSLSAENAH